MKGRKGFLPFLPKGKQQRKEFYESIPRVVTYRYNGGIPNSCKRFGYTYKYTNVIQYILEHIKIISVLFSLGYCSDSFFF